MSQTADRVEETQAGASGRLQGRLGVFSIVFMVVAAAAPLTILVSSPLNMLASTGGELPLDYFIGPLLLLVFAGGFALISMKVKKAGAFYSYVTAGLGRPLGVGSGFMAMFGYLVFQSFVYVLMGFTTNALFASFGSPFNLDWYWWTIISLVIVAILGYFNIELSAKVLTIALILEVLVIVVVDLAILFQGGSPAGIDFTSFSGAQFSTPAWPLGIVFGISIGLGFEATAIFRDEARDPEKTIPRAIFVSIISAAVFYSFALWGLIQGFGTAAVVEFLGGQDDPTAMFYIAAEQFVGAWFSQVAFVLSVTSMFACVLSYHNITARYLHSLGHSVLPTRLTFVHKKFVSPYVASITTSVIGAVFFLVTITVTLSGQDPFVFMQWEIAIATVSIIILLLLTSIAILVFFVRNPSVRGGVWSTWLSPIFSIVIFGFLVIAAYTNFSSLSFADPSVNAVLMVMPFVVLALGIVVALIAKSVSPARYEGLREDTAAIKTQ